MIFEICYPFIIPAVITFCRTDLGGEVEHSFLNGVNRKLSAIHSDPAAAQFFGDGKSRAAAGEGVEDDVVFVR